MNGIADSLPLFPPGSEVEQLDQIERQNWPPKDGQVVALIEQR